VGKPALFAIRLAVSSYYSSINLEGDFLLSTLAINKEHIFSD
jgi:hypothetical protein